MSTVRPLKEPQFTCSPADTGKLHLGREVLKLAVTLITLAGLTTVGLALVGYLPPFAGWMGGVTALSAPLVYLLATCRRISYQESSPSPKTDEEWPSSSRRSIILKLSSEPEMTSSERERERKLKGKEEVPS